MKCLYTNTYSTPHKGHFWTNVCVRTVYIYSVCMLRSQIEAWRQVCFLQYNKLLFTWTFCTVLITFWQRLSLIAHSLTEGKYLADLFLLALDRVKIDSSLPLPPTQQDLKHWLHVLKTWWPWSTGIGLKWFKLILSCHQSVVSVNVSSSFRSKAMSLPSFW